ncbi:MAG: hypothetical protein HY282_16705 [Nitrospirae bacterium]|nr:hypothetical protein [Candidatus Manganitrophaceae bacterium]
MSDVISPRSSRNGFNVGPVGRTNDQSELAVINGENIPAIGYFDLIGLEYQPLPRPSDPVKLIDGLGDLIAAVAYVRSGELTISDWIRSRRGKKKYVTFRLEDLGPVLAALPTALRRLAGECSELVLGSGLKRRLKRLFFF